MDEEFETMPVTEEPAVAQTPAKKKGHGKAIVLTVVGIFAGTLLFVGGMLLGKGIPNGTGTVALPTVAPQEKTTSDYTFETKTSDDHYTVKAVAAMTMDSVVEITTEQVTTGSFFGQYVTSGAGSGVIIREDGLVATNHHVIDGASQIIVRLRSGKEYEATVVGSDSEADIALLKIEETGLPVATMGDSSALVVGDEVIAIGNPLGKLGGTVTNGIISALERQINVEGQIMTLLQTNAAINHGNSGGGLFNDAGELIGIVNAGPSEGDAQGIGFAIPINTAKPVIEDLLNYGYVRGKVKLGVSLVDINTERDVRYYGVPEPGTYVSELTEGGDAEKAGLKGGDRLLTINGKTIASMEDVSAVLKTASVGDTITFGVVRYTYTSSWRNDYKEEKLTVAVKLTEYRSDDPLIQ